MLWWTLRRLKSKDPKVREQAAQKLGEAKTPRAVEALVALLSEGPDMRKTVTAILERIGNDAVEPLAKFLLEGNLGLGRHGYSSSTIEARMAAVTLLGQIGGMRASEVLLKVLRNTKEYGGVNATAARALGQIGDERAIEPLVVMLIDVTVRKVATSALLKFGGAIVKTLLNKATNHTLPQGAIDVLQQVLNAEANSVTSEDLRAIAQFSNVVQIKYEWICEMRLERTEKVDCSQLRQLARQELIRRGL